MKTERLVVMASLEFKAFLSEEAQAEGISVSELVRQRCLRKPTDDERLLSDLAKQLTGATKAADAALDAGLQAVETSVSAIRRMRAQRDEGVPA